MKLLFKIITVLIVTFTLNVSSSLAQSCDSIVKVTESYLQPQSDNDLTFVSDGQVYRAFLDEEQTAEFRTTLYGGTRYRIAASAGVEDRYIIFNVYDQDRNLLFSNKEHSNEPYWDFQVNATLECIVEAKLDLDRKVSGCAVILMGFAKVN